jgi:hypothetical protein
VLLHINADIFYIDAYLLDIGNDVEIILGTPWLAGLGRLTWTCPPWSYSTFAKATPSPSPPYSHDMLWLPFAPYQHHH